MKKKSVADGFFWMGAVDWNRRIFDALIPTPNGTSYNSWLIRTSTSTVLIDTVDPVKVDVLMSQLADIDRIDFIVVQHAEQDHSGSLPVVMERYPEAVALCTPKCKKIVSRLLPAVNQERIRTVEDKEILDIGDGKSLEFMHMPWVHWPETMVTWYEQAGILFSCDLFGSHLATSKLVEEWEVIFEPAKRYYAEIMMPFGKKITGYLDRLDELPVKLICPSHGPMHDKPELITGAYRKWTSAPPETGW